MGVCEALFLKMQPHLVTNIKIVRNMMSIMSLLIRGIGLLQDIMNMLLVVLDLFKIFGYSIYLGLSGGESNGEV
jgi:hypothetical protein